MDTNLIIRNPDASGTLTLNINVTVNTSEEKILSNVLENSKKIHKWVNQCEPNGRTLLICGSGPSIKNELETIKSLKGDIWGLNNCATWLHANGVTADYQVIMDAQPETASLIARAKDYLFASQVDPELFRIKPNATLWHATYGNKLVDEQDGFPEHKEGYSLIGSSISVGNTSLVLAYIMGYRDIHIFGMDSSHDGVNGHVTYQFMNKGDPLTIVKFNGKDYVSSLTMKLQAEHFIERVNALKECGCEFTVHGTGLIPDIYNAGKMEEKSKYEAMWDIPSYRICSPGENVADKFLEIVKPSGKIIDYGCGTGRGSVKIHKAGHDILLLDFTENSRDEEAKKLPFLQQDLTEKIPHKADYGFCTDVMEHIPPDDVEKVIKNIIDSCYRVFWQISTVPDSMGVLIGQQLHLTVKPHSWWKEKLIELGCKVEWEACYPSESQFYITRKD